MKKTKRKPVKVPKQHQCNCPYNHQISNIYTEAFEAKINDSEHDEEYGSALLHNDQFNMMAECLADDEHDPRLVMADAVRFGFEAGRRLVEIKNLEKSIGY